MIEDPTLWQLEYRFWTGGEQVYRDHVSHDALMVFRDAVMTKEEVLASIADQRWHTVDMTDCRTLRLTEDVVALSYHASASRKGEAIPYSAKVTSVYVHRGACWVLALHQQTT